MIPEKAVYDFLSESIQAAAPESALFGIALHDTFFRLLDADLGIRIGDCETELSPLPGGDAVEEFNARLTLVVFSRIPKDDWEDRGHYRDQVSRICRAAALLFYNDPRLGQRVNDARILGARRGYDSITNSDRFAVANLDVIINEMGQQIGG